MHQKIPNQPLILRTRKQFEELLAGLPNFRRRIAAAEEFVMHPIFLWRALAVVQVAANFVGNSSFCQVVDGAGWGCAGLGGVLPCLDVLRVGGPVGASPVHVDVSRAAVEPVWVVEGRVAGLGGLLFIPAVGSSVRYFGVGRSVSEMVEDVRRGKMSYISPR